VERLATTACEQRGRDQAVVDAAREAAGVDDAASLRIIVDGDDRIWCRWNALLEQETSGAAKWLERDPAEGHDRGSRRGRHEATHEEGRRRREGR